MAIRPASSPTQQSLLSGLVFAHFIQATATVRPQYFHLGTILDTPRAESTNFILRTIVILPFPSDAPCTPWASAVDQPRESPHLFTTRSPCLRYEPNPTKHGVTDDRLKSAGGITFHEKATMANRCRP